MPKKKLNVKSEEIRKAENLQHSLSDLEHKLNWIPEPTHLFTVGDRVDIGNLRDVVVEEVLHNGKIVKIDFTSIDHNYGNPIRHEHEKRYVKWVDIRLPSTNAESFIQNRDLKLYYTQRDLESLFSMVYHFGLDDSPSYQRDYVWDLSDKVALIDSIFQNIDIGKFVFINLPYTDDGAYYEVLDGKQRVRAILDFYEDRFEYKGKTFSQLSLRDQNHFRTYPISYAEARDLSDEQKIRYFLMLNTAGKVMDTEHLAKVAAMLSNAT